MIASLLDHIWGDRDWSVILTIDGTPWATRRWLPVHGERLVRTNLRQGQAQSLALRMRETDHNTPRAVI